MSSDKSLNIVYHHRTQGTGAEGVHIGRVINSLREIGHTVDVVAPVDSDPTRTGGDNPFAEKLGFKARFLDRLSRVLPQFMFELLELLYNQSAKKKLSMLLSNKKVDLLYERSAFFLYAGARIAMKRGIPYIVEVNEVSGEDRVRKQFFVSYAKKIEQEVFKAADAIIVVSTFLKEKVVSMGVAAEKVHVIPNAADEKIFNPSNVDGSVREGLGITEDQIVIGFIGWFVAWHNFELLIEALEKAANKNIRLMLVGDGSLKEKIQSDAEKRGCADQLIFPGAVKYEKIPDYVSAMDICVIPGSNQYRSPIKLFEYMIMGKPVLAPKLEPIEFIVKDGESAALFESGELESLIQSISRLVDDENLRDEIGKNARALILERHLWVHNAERVVSLLGGFEAK